MFQLKINLTSTRYDFTATASQDVRLRKVESTILQFILNQCIAVPRGCGFKVTPHTLNGLKNHTESGVKSIK